MNLLAMNGRKMTDRTANPAILGSPGLQNPYFKSGWRKGKRLINNLEAV
jgi:hypothetical protein